MKITNYLRSITLLSLAVISFCTAQGQTKLIINGAKLNVDTSTILSVNDLIINNSTVNISVATLKVAGAITTAAGLNAVDGAIEWNGTSNQDIPAGSFAANIIKYMKINSDAQVSVSGPLGITDNLNLTSGNLAGGGYLSLKSTLLKTARVLPVSNNASVSASGIVVERFIPAKRAYRFLTAPVNTTGDIRSNWMENSNNTNPYININPNPGFGTQISGTGGSINGFDATNTNNPSMFGYNNSSQAWVRVPNTFAQMHAGEPFRIIIRGDRSTDLGINNPWPTNTILRANGALVTGTIVFTQPGVGGTSGMETLSDAGTGYSFIGNPYASPIDWNQLERNNVTGTMYIFDPTLNGTNGRGAYVAYNASTGINNLSSAIDNNIQSGQAFFIQNNGTNPSLTIKEIHKTGANRAVFRTGNALPHLSLQLLLPGQDTTGQSADGLSVYFADAFENTLGDEDSYKYYNPDENLSIVRYDSLLSIEGRKPVVNTDTLPLKIWQMNTKSYLFRSVVSDFDQAITPYLEDAFLQNVTLLNNVGETLVPFTVTTNPLSYATNRFRIVFKNTGTLALNFTSINAYNKAQGNQIEWTTATENNLKNYEVQRSQNAQSFSTIGNVHPGNTALANYSWFDAEPFNGDNYYRIKSVSNSGITQLSRVVKVSKTNTEDISITANTVSNKVLMMQIKNAPSGTYDVSLINSAGQKIYNGLIAHTGLAKETINLDNLLAAGVYHLQVLIKGRVYSVALMME